MVIILVIAVLGGTLGFDTGVHEDISINALEVSGFAETGRKIVTLGNWFTDYYSYVEQPNKKLLHKFHFDLMNDATDILRYWKALAENTKNTIQPYISTKDYLPVMLILGATLHTVQDFYSHANWVETHPRNGSCDCYRFDTIASKSEAEVLAWGNRLYSGASSLDDIPEYTNTGRLYASGSSEDDHGDYCKGVNHDSNNRPNYQEAYTFAFAGCMEWIIAFQGWVNDASFWNSMQTYSVSGNDLEDLNKDYDKMYGLSAFFHTWTSNSGHYRGAGSGHTRKFLTYYTGYQQTHSFLRSIFEGLIDNKFPGIAAGMYGSSSVVTSWPPFTPYSGSHYGLLVRTVAVYSTRKRDLQAYVTIGGTRSREAPQIDIKDQPNSLWTAIKFTDQGSVSLSYQIIDAGVEALADDVAMAFYGSKTNVNLMYTRATNTLSGDISGSSNENNVLTLTGDQVSVKLYITARPACSAVVTALSVANPNMAEAPKTQCGAVPVVYYCTQTDAQRRLDFFDNSYLTLIPLAALVLLIPLIIACCCSKCCACCCICSRCDRCRCCGCNRNYHARERRQLGHKGVLHDPHTGAHHAHAAHGGHHGGSHHTPGSNHHTHGSHHGAGVVNAGTDYSDEYSPSSSLSSSAGGYSLSYPGSGSASYQDV